MTIAAAQELKTRAQAAFCNLAAQTKGLEPYLERSDEPFLLRRGELGKHGADLVARACIELLVDLAAFRRQLALEI